uniref:Membrane-spanning 4-domains subfamily A member 4A-like n=1 Tax=Leptobrachium leishanense TaxID=445787 RepID=A0A8C5PKH9_9ANUR
MAAPQGTFIMVPQWVANPVPQAMAVPNVNTQQANQILNKGQPKALGATQLVLAFLQISLGTVLFFTTPDYYYYYLSITTYSGINFWGSVFYIISGSLSVAAENKPSRSMVRGFLAMNIISSLVSITAIIIFITDASIYYYDYYYCGQYNNCSEYYILHSNKTTVLIYLIISSLLHFCVCVSLSAFGCKYLSRHSNPPTQVFVIQNDYQQPGSNVSPAFVNPYPGPPNHVGLGNTGYGVPMSPPPPPERNQKSY